MARAATLMPLRLARRMCLACGFNGRAIQSISRENGWVCPRCGLDLYARPPKSYAELEALSDSNPGSPIDDDLLRVRRRSLLTLAATIVGESLCARRRVWLFLAILGAGAFFGVGVWLGRIL